MHDIYTKLPELLPLRPAMVLGGASWIQHLWYHGGISPSATLAARFRSAHASARAGLPGLLQTEIEQGLLANPIIFLGAGSVDSADTRFTPMQLAWMLGARFAISPLRPETVRSIFKYAGLLRSALPGHGGTLPVRSSVASISAPLAPAASQMLEWALNTPPFSAAYVLCLGDLPASDEVVMASSGELDEARLQQAVRAVIPKPTPAQRCISRLVCFFCGAHPLSKGVQLALCGGCEAVAYCSKACAEPDWTEHHRECARIRPRTHQSTGLTALPALGLSVSRGDTESRKVMSVRSPIILPPSPAGMWAPESLERLALVPTIGSGGVTYTRQWTVKGGSGGDLDSALRSARRS